MSKMSLVDNVSSRVSLKEDLDDDEMNSIEQSVNSIDFETG